MTESDNMVERVANAIQDELPPSDNLDPWGVDELYLKAARAAIAAMRKPTEAMMETAFYLGAPASKNYVDVKADEAKIIWETMIDTALGQPEHTGKL